MRTGCFFGAAMLVCALVGAQEEIDFAEENDGDRLESILADLRQAQGLALRWRVRGAEWDREQMQFYRRVEWQWGKEREFYLVTERDPGERRWADFAALYLKWRMPERPLEWVGGDLLPGWGSGLICGRAAGRGGLPLDYPGRDSERIGYRSSGENRALRGVALRGRRGGLRAMAIGGRAWRDGRVDEVGTVTSLPESGYHVTGTEEAGRRLLGLWAGGGRLRYQGGQWRAGASWLVLHFDRPVDLRRPERKPWAFGGDRQRLWGVDGEVDLGRVEMRGEGARDDQGHRGAVAGVRVKLGRTRLRGVARWYDPGFVSFFGGAPSRAGMENERGLFVALERRGWQVFADRYRRPERTYYYPLPATVSAWGASAKWRPVRRLEARMLFREDRRPYWREEQSVKERSRRLRAELEWGRGKGRLARLRLRLEGRHLGRSPGEDEGGGVLGMLWKGQGKRGYCVVHFTGFSTESYFSRLYEYEYDLPGAVSIRPLYGRGWRGYALVGVKGKRLEISGRYRLQRDQRTRQYGGVQVDVRMGP